MKDSKKTTDLSEKAISQMQNVEKHLASTRELLKKTPNIETLISIDERVRQIDKIDANKTIEVYEKLLTIMESENIFRNKIPHDILKFIGFNYYRLEKWQRALDEFLVYIDDEREDTEILYSIAYCYGRLKNPQKAAEYYETLTKINSQIPSAFNNWGAALVAIYRETKDINYLKLAIEKQKKAVVIKPDYSGAFNNLGGAYATLYHIEKNSTLLDEGLKYSKKALEVDPENRAINYNIACIYSLMQKSEEMLVALKKAIEHASYYRSVARDDEDFKNYLNNPKFIALTKEQSVDQLWQAFVYEFRNYLKPVS
jgi:tetratricopeptide (TPR) repeat protein